MVHPACAVWTWATYVVPFLCWCEEREGESMCQKQKNWADLVDSVSGVPTDKVTEVSDPPPPLWSSVAC